VVIEIDSQGLTKIYNAGQVVTLLRRVDQIVETDAVAALPVVAWQAFAPMQTNTVTWTNDFYCFATTTLPVIGAVLEINATSNAPVQAGTVYAFTQGQFVQQQKSQSPQSYVVSNATPTGSYAFGLAQTAVVNSVPTLAPFCVMPVLYNEQAYFNPTNVISTFLSSAKAPGAVLLAPSNACDVTVTSGSNGPTLGFNDQTNLFFQLSESSS
jgi:hypothetical protein